jgi:cytochrome c-type biogenesis protein CcmH
MTRQDIEQMVERLTTRLRDAPGDVESWLMLARSQTSLGNFNLAASAYDAAVGYAPSNPNILADYADVLAMSQGRRFDGEPDRLIARALQADPRHLKALALSGSSAFARKDYRVAVERWNAALGLVPAESQPARSLRASIGQAQAALAGGTASTVAGSEAVIRGTVAIDAKLAGRFMPDDVVFVFARRLDGPRIPLAVARLRAGSLPAPFELNDSMSMNPSMKLSSAARVQLEAKISRSGTATPAPGDLFGIISPVAIGSNGVRLNIAEVRP